MLRLEYTLAVADVTSFVVFSSPRRIVNKLFRADWRLKYSCFEMGF